MFTEQSFDYSVSQVLTIRKGGALNRNYRDFSQDEEIITTVN